MCPSLKVTVCLLVSSSLFVCLGLTDSLRMLLKDHGIILPSAADSKIVTVVKETSCDVAMSYKEEMTKIPGSKEFTNYLVGR